MKGSLAFLVTEHAGAMFDDAGMHRTFIVKMYKNYHAEL